MVETKLFRCRITGDVVIDSQYGLSSIINDKTNAIVPGLMRCYSKQRDKIVGCLSSEACNEVVDDILDEHLGFDLHEVIFTKQDLEKYLEQYCDQVEELLDERHKERFISSRQIFCAFLIDKFERLRFYTTRNGLDITYPTIIFMYDEFEGQKNKTFLFIKGGLVEDEQDVTI